MDLRFYEALKSLFATHPNTNVFFGTTDCSFFFSQHEADQHAKTLPNKSVVEVARDEFEDMDEPLSEAELRDYEIEVRNNLNKSFSDEFGFDADPNDSNEALHVAICSLRCYKVLNPPLDLVKVIESAEVVLNPETLKDKPETVIVENVETPVTGDEAKPEKPVKAAKVKTEDQNEKA